MPARERWRATWHGLGGAADDELHRSLMSCYAEPHRHYHTARHLDDCFASLDEARRLAERIFEVELALWFHDAVYDVRRHDNEERSASWAARALEQAGLSGAVQDRVAQLILATKHDARPASGDAALLTDVDLGILGATPDRFDEYERQIRAEYSWVPHFLFRRTRRQILESFLARPSIYTTGHFRARFEAAARANLARSVQRLAGRRRTGR